MSYLGISLRYNIDGNLVVNSFFDKSRSWCKSNDSNFLLNHEQRHFDLFEIYARKIREYFSENKFNKNTLTQIVSSKVITFNQELSELSEFYDYETNYSLDSAQQNKWNVYIDSQLISLNKYSDSIVVLKYYD